MKSILKNNMYIFAFGIIFAVPATFLLTPANTLLGIGYFLIFLFICSMAVSIVTWISCQSFFHGIRAFLLAYGIIFAVKPHTTKVACFPISV